MPGLDRIVESKGAMMGTDPNKLVSVYEAMSEFEANAVAAALRADGYEATVLATGHAMLPIGAIGKIGVSVLVRAADLAGAGNSIRKNKKDSVDIDWADVDVGEMEDDAPPVQPSLGQRVGGFGPGFRMIRNTGIVLTSIALMTWIMPTQYLVFAIGFAIMLWGVSMFDQAAIMRAKTKTSRIAGRGS